MKRGKENTAATSTCPDDGRLLSLETNVTRLWDFVNVIAAVVTDLPGILRIDAEKVVSVAHDFGSGIVRDVQVVGARLIAVVGGDVSFAFDSVLGYPIQRDRGGPLVLVDLASGAETVLPGNALAFRRPALAPSATRLVAEAVANVADLWMFDLP